MLYWLLSAAGPRQPDTSWLKSTAKLNMSLIPSDETDETIQLEISELKRYAVLNILSMLVTDDTSQLERSELNLYAS